MHIDQTNCVVYCNDDDSLENKMQRNIIPGNVKYMVCLANSAS